MALKPIFRSTIFALILVIGQAFGGFIISPIFKFFHVSLPVAIVLGQIIVLLIPTIIYFIVTKQSVKEVLKLNSIGFLDVIIIIAIGICSQPIAMFIGFAANLFFPNVISKVMLDIVTLPLAAKLGIMALTPAICEEITVRGIILSGYKNVNHVVSAIITGFIFGILHMNLQQFFYAFALGVLLAYLVHITNSIFASMLCHFTFNGISTLLTSLVSTQTDLSKAGAPDINKIGSFEKIAALVMLFIVAVIFAAIVGLLIWALIGVNKNKKLKRQFTIESMSDVGFNEEMSFVLKEPKESIFNWPLAAIVVTFIVVQVMDFYIK